MKRSRFIILYPIAAIVMMIISLWLTSWEGPYKQMMEVTFIPSDNHVSLEIVMEGSNLKAYISHGSVTVVPEYGGTDRQGKMRVEGSIPEEQLHKPVVVSLISDLTTGEAEGRVLSTEGISAATYAAKSEANRMRLRYIGLTILMILVMAALLIWNRRMGKQKGRLAYAVELLHELETDPHTRDSFLAGQEYFLEIERRRIVDTAAVVFFGWLSAMWNYLEIYSPNLLQNMILYMLKLVIAVAVLVLLSLNRKRMLICPLVQYNRPLSAVTACLLEGICGYGVARVRAMSIYHAAVGMYRSGRTKEAMLLSDLAMEMRGRRKKGLFAFCLSDLRCQCFRRLGEREKAEREAVKLEIILEEEPFLARNRDVRLRSQKEKVLKLAGAGDLGQAAQEGAAYLERCNDDYRRLPMLALMAEISDSLGKRGEAAGLRQRILKFSPENQEVAAAMAYGPCTYVSSKMTVGDRGGLLLRIAFGLLIFLLAIRLIGERPADGHQTGVDKSVQTETKSCLPCRDQ